MSASSKILAPITNITTVLDEQSFPVDLLLIILGYVIEIITENPYQYNTQSIFLENIIAAYATYISHNLVWNIKIDETLTFAEQEQQGLLPEVKIKDPHGQRMRGATLQILHMMGDRNPRQLKGDEKDYGLVERIRPAFSSMPNEYNRQSEAWHSTKDSKEAEKTMVPVIAAMEKLCQEICESKEITDYKDFEQYLNLPMAEKFRKAIQPDPNHVVTEGFNWDWKIFLKFFEIFEAYVNNDKVQDKNRPNLDGWWTLKSDVFDAIVWPALQARVPRCDIPHVEKGIGKTDNDGMPRRIDFSDGVPELAGFGRQFFFGFYGSKYAPTAPPPWDREPRPVVEMPFFSKLMSSKTSITMWNQAATATGSNETVSDNVMGSTSIAKAAK